MSLFTYLPVYSITFDEFSGKFNTKTPIWFDLEDYNSLSYWIIFYLEISLWIHYLAYVRSMFKVAPETLPNKHSIFMPSEGQYLNLKNEISNYWESSKNDSLLKEISDEIYKRSMKLKQVESREVSAFHGGLQFNLNINTLQTENQIISILL